jgi:hypothetical protein
LRCALAFERNARTPSVTRFLEEISYRNPMLRPAVLVSGACSALVVAAIGGLYFLKGAQPSAPPAATAGLEASKTPPAGQGAAATGEQTAPAGQAPATVQTPPTAAPGPAEAAPAPSPPPPAAAPAPTMAAVTAALGGVPCAALVPLLRERMVRVEGFLQRSYGQARLKNVLAALPGVANVELAIQEVDDNKCALLGALGRYWVAQRTAGAGTLMRLNAASGKGGNRLVEGDTLMVDVTTPGFESYVTVDYFVLDGSVVHLLPNLRARENLAPANYTATVGSLGNWVIGKPFGNEMLVLIATPVPPFDNLRPESEPGAGYLQALERQLAKISKERGPSAVVVDFLQISTSGKR